MQPFLRCCRCTPPLRVCHTPVPPSASTPRRTFTNSPPLLASKPSGPAPDRSPQGPLTDPPQFGKKKPRSPQGGKALLKRAAAAAASSQKPSHAPKSEAPDHLHHQHHTRTPQTSPIPFRAQKPRRIVTAYNTADKYDLQIAIRLLRAQGYIPDPFTTNLLDDVIHLRISLGSPSTTTIPPAGPASIGSHSPAQPGVEKGDIFIFPSGNIVSWDVPEGQISGLAGGLVGAADNPVKEWEVEREDLEWVEVTEAKGGWVRGEIIYVGIGAREELDIRVGMPSPVGNLETARTEEGRTDAQITGDANAPSNPTTALQTIPPPPFYPQVPPIDHSETLPVLLTKLAFSSGLSRSTKLAHLESLLSSYLHSISPIPTHLASPPRFPFLLLSILRQTGSRTPYTYTRSFILRKTGELLLLRAQLNLYSELTDPLPDLFWDTKHELGLERAYEEVGRALDVERRIEVANERMGYASDVVGTLRGALSERHGLVLEWMIIVLIAVEVGFEVNRLLKERGEKRRAGDRGRGVVHSALGNEILTPDKALVLEEVKQKESGEAGVDALRKDLEELIVRQRKLLLRLETSAPPQVSSPEPPPTLAEQPIQALLATE